jgi:hypothetical protein
MRRMIMMNERFSIWVLWRAKNGYCGILQFWSKKPDLYDLCSYVHSATLFQSIDAGKMQALINLAEGEVISDGHSLYSLEQHELRSTRLVSDIPEDKQ